MQNSKKVNKIKRIQFEKNKRGKKYSKRRKNPLIIFGSVYATEAKHKQVSL